MAFVRKEGVTYEVPDKPVAPKPKEKKAPASDSSKNLSVKTADKKSKK